MHIKCAGLCRNAQYQDVNMRTSEIPQSTRITGLFFVHGVFNISIMRVVNYITLDHAGIKAFHVD